MNKFGHDITVKKHFSAGDIKTAGNNAEQSIMEEYPKNLTHSSFLFKGQMVVSQLQSLNTMIVRLFKP